MHASLCIPKCVCVCVCVIALCRRLLICFSVGSLCVEFNFLYTQINNRHCAPTWRIDFQSIVTFMYMHSLNLIVLYVRNARRGKNSPIGGRETTWVRAGRAIYLFYLGWLWTGIGDLDGLIGRQPPGVPLDVNAGVHSGLLLRLPPCPSSSVSAASSSQDRFPKVPRVTPGPLLGAELLLHQSTVPHLKKKTERTWIYTAVAMNLYGSDI